MFLTKKVDYFQLRFLYKSGLQISSKETQFDFLDIYIYHIFIQEGPSHT